MEYKLFVYKLIIGILVSNMANGTNFNDLAKSVGIFAFGAAVYLFVAPKLFSEPPFIQGGQIFVPGLSPEQQVEADMQDAALSGAVTFADDRIPGVMPHGMRLGGAY